jgi:hypothetical protein
MTVTPGPGAGRSRRFEMAGAFRRVRASEKYALGKKPSRQLPVRRPAGCYGVRIGRCPCSSGAAGPCRGLVLCEPVRIRAVTGVGPRRSANAGCRRSLVRRTWWRDGYPRTGLAASQPRRQRRDGRVRHGYSPRHPRTRPDMAGRQRQPVPVTSGGPDAVRPDTTCLTPIVLGVAAARGQRRAAAAQDLQVNQASLPLPAAGLARCADGTT